MSLLTKPKMITRWRKMLLVVVSILLLVPCVGVAAFNMRFDLEVAQDRPTRGAVKQVERRNRRSSYPRARGLLLTL